MPDFPQCLSAYGLFSRAWLACGLLALCAGCGSSDPLERQAVSGKVTLHGAPLDAGSIQFMPAEGHEGRGLAGGATIANGEYSIAQVRGLPPGVYKVMIFSAGAVPAASAEPGAIAPPMEERIPAEFNVNSEHTVTVVAGEAKSFDFDIP